MCLPSSFDFDRSATSDLISVYCGAEVAEQGL